MESDWYEMRWVAARKHAEARGAKPWRAQVFASWTCEDEQRSLAIPAAWHNYLGTVITGMS